MPKQLIAFSLFWNFVLFLTPGPAHSNFDSGNCTADNSAASDGNLVTSVTPTCSNDSAAVEVVARSYDDIRNGDRRHATLLLRIDYICVGNDGQQIRGTPWTTDYRDRRINVTNLDTFFDVKNENNPQFTATVQQSLPPGTNCTFYLCYKQRRTDSDQLGRTSPVSCVTELNECNIANGGCEHSCTDTIGSFTCSCDTGYQLDENGLNCSDINECNVTNGGCEQICTNNIGSFICSCDTGYQLDENGLNCSDINECNVTNGGCEQICTNNIGRFICSCDTGYQLDGNGLNCSDINECESDDLNNCHENAQCTNTEGNYTCSCNPGYSGDGVNCMNIDECQLNTHTCSSNANCTDTDGSFNCTCREGFEGNGFNCTDIPECERELDDCDPNADCTNTVGGYICTCNIGFTGDGHMCPDIDECLTDTDNCHENATCNNTFGSFECTCNVGFEGDGVNCTNINECELETYPCHSNASCTDTDGSFNCTCREGFEGNGFNCTDIPECERELDDCDPNADCTNTVGGYICTCNIGFTGDGHMCPDIDECLTDTDNCHENATCNNTFGSFECTCNVGFEGDGVNCTNLSSKEEVLLAILLPAAVLIAILSVAICVMYNIRRQDNTMSEVQKLFYKDEIDLSYNPISPFSKLSKFPSIISEFDKLCNPPDTATHTGNTDTDSKSEIIPNSSSELMTNLVHKSSTSLPIVSPNTKSFVTSSSDNGYYVSNAPQSTVAVFLDKEEGSTSPPCYPIEESEDHQNSINSETDTQNENNFGAGDSNDMPAHTLVEESNGYIQSEHGPFCTFDGNNHIVESESEFLPTMFSEEAADLQPIPAMVKSEGSYIQSYPCLSDTRVLASVKENHDSLRLQNPETSSIYIGAEDKLSLTMMSSSEQMQHLSTSTGYIKDCSKPGDVPY